MLVIKCVVAKSRGGKRLKILIVINLVQLQIKLQLILEFNFKTLQVKPPW